MPFKTPANNVTIQPTSVTMKPTFGSMDNLGRVRMSRHQNIYEADFEYGAQPMRWENFVYSPNVSITATGTTGNVISTSSNTGAIQLGMPIQANATVTAYPGTYVVAVNTTPGSNSITLSQAPYSAITTGTVTVGGQSSVSQLPGSGGVRMRLSPASGDATVRQTRPYHRYQPGKTMVMSTAMNFGAAQVGQRQRVGFFDDGNGMFIEQGDPVYANVLLTYTGSTQVGNNVISNLSSTANLYPGMAVSGPGVVQTVGKLDPSGYIAVPANSVITAVINSSAVAISQPTNLSTVANSYQFSMNANPFGMFCVIRTDIQAPSVTAQGSSGGIVADTRYPLPCWIGDQATIQSIDWSRIQMIWQEYTWYGAGMTRWGVVINGEWIVLHYVGFGNRGPLNSSQLVNANTVTVTPAQQTPWSRTGNLPVRYEQRNLGPTSVQNDMYHYGVSVVVEGGQDDQRGFTYSYGMPGANIVTVVPNTAIRQPVLSIQGRALGTIEMSGNVTFNAANASSTNTTLFFTTPNTTFDGVLTTTASFSMTPSNNIITLVNGSISNVVIGQAVTSSQSGFPASANVVTVNSTAITLSAPFGGASPVTATANVYTQNFFVGRHIYFPQQGNNYGTAPFNSNTGITARITASNSSTIVFSDIVTSRPIANTTTMTGTPYQIGLLNRGQILPKTMYISANGACLVELITSTTASPILLTGAQWNTEANISQTNTVYGQLTQATGFTIANGATLSFAGLGSNNSFAQRDVKATALSGGEVVFSFIAPAGGSGLQQIDLSYFFPLYNTIAGNLTDILSVAITNLTLSSVGIGCHIIAQEAMS